MIKYVDTGVVFREIPDEITLAINISNCPIHCPDCHSKELWKNIGKDLSQRALERLISENSGISCVCFMGGDAEPDVIALLAECVKRKYPDLKVGWYSGKEELPDNLDNFDYVKLGPYIKEKGGLDNPDTNQVLYEIKHPLEITNITSKFWKNG